jgi:MFS family permease
MELLVYGAFVLLSILAYGARHQANKTSEKKLSVSNANFKGFQKSFFLVYFLALLGDWLQGPYVYKLYAFYKFEEAEIAILYVAGFASSVMFGTCTGPLADLFGRKKATILFSIIYTFCCLTKLSSDFQILLIGRICGGIATSMLFSTFESWYVYEHSERHGYPVEWIGITFSISTFWNGMLAIIAGVLANVGAETLGYGPVAPFVLALVPLIACGILVVSTWEENYGDRKSNFGKSCMDGLRIIFSNQSILLLGSLQSILETCMYIFVFLWTPVLDSESTPLGMVFSCFMVCIMIGSSMFTLLEHKGKTAEEILRYALYLVAITMAVCCFTANKDDFIYKLISFLSFLLLEVGIGMYFPSISVLRGQIIPESHRANVMNWFRVPMNCLTCGALLSLKVEAVSKDKRIVFAFCLVLASLGILLASKFIDLQQGRKTSTRSSTEEEKREAKVSLLDAEES